MSDGTAVPTSCCGTGRVYDFVAGERLGWSVDHECGALECGRGELPEDLRRAIMEHYGVFRLRFAADPGSRRVAVMKVLREFGTPLSRLKAVLEDGLTGTEAEMTVARRHLARAGVALVLERQG
ncbi:hypothetical protein [Actinoplanes regularis]|nr:hypothetical protein [Actinoplanes regularis]GIE88358.1 hypothetical protein Are01nite_48380 [Actinoplanes regularis]